LQIDDIRRLMYMAIINVKRYVPETTEYPVGDIFYGEMARRLGEYFGNKGVKGVWTEPDCMLDDGSFYVKTHPSQTVIAFFSAPQKTLDVADEYASVFSKFGIKRVVRRASGAVPDLLIQRQKKYKRQAENPLVSLS
jgi:hypothetical protein